MSSLRFASRVAILAVLLASWPPAVRACSCGKQTVEDAFSLAPFVFVGKVVKLEVVGGENGIDWIRATLEVSEVFKGNPASEVIFMTDNGCCYCSYGFEIAKEYLLYAIERQGAYDTSACSRSNLVAAAEEDLRFLRSAGRGR